MDMKRVGEIEAQLRYATQHQTLPGRWSHNINELIEGVKQQQEQIERYKEALEFYANRQAYYGASDHNAEVMQDYGKIARAALDQ